MFTEGSKLLISRKRSASLEPKSASFIWVPRGASLLCTDKGAAIKTW